MGLRVVRFGNEEVKRDLAGVLRGVREEAGVVESFGRLTLSLVQSLSILEIFPGIDFGFFRYRRQIGR